MAPELIENKKYGLKCDIWSWGILMYTLWTGEFPF